MTFIKGDKQYKRHHNLDEWPENIKHFTKMLKSILELHHYKDDNGDLRPVIALKLDFEGNEYLEIDQRETEALIKELERLKSLLIHDCNELDYLKGWDKDD